MGTEGGTNVAFPLESYFRPNRVISGVHLASSICSGQPFSSPPLHRTCPPPQSFLVPVHFPRAHLHSGGSEPYPASPQKALLPAKEGGRALVPHREQLWGLKLTIKVILMANLCPLKCPCPTHLHHSVQHGKLHKEGSVTYSSTLKIERGLNNTWVPSQSFSDQATLLSRMSPLSLDVFICKMGLAIFTSVDC